MTKGAMTSPISNILRLKSTTVAEEYTYTNTTALFQPRLVASFCSLHLRLPIARSLDL